MARPLHRRRRRRIRRQSLLGLDNSLNCTNISANYTVIAAFFYSKLSQKGDMKFSFKKNVLFLIHYTFIVDLIRKFDARK